MSEFKKSTETILRRPWWRMVFDVLSGFHLATSLLLLLGVLTWLSTLEQVDQGLYPTLEKYFDWKSVFVVPEISGKRMWFALPSGYWVCVLLLLNLILGGIIRARKGWKHAGNLIAHLGIILMLVAGGVADLFTVHGNVAIQEGETSDAVEDFQEYVVEIAEWQGAEISKIYVVRGAELAKAMKENVREFALPGFPFDLSVTGFVKHGLPIAAMEQAPRNNEVSVDGYYLREEKRQMKSEADTAACYVRVTPHQTPQDAKVFIVAGASFHPYTLNVGGRLFTVDMRKNKWKLPFAVTLDKFDAEFYPGTSKPAKFVSDVTRHEHGSSVPVRIQMNEPMRHEGFTFFQASYGPPGAKPGDKMYSVFEVVKNPSDKWPEYSLYIVGFGLAVTFLTKLASYLKSQLSK